MQYKAKLVAGIIAISLTVGSAFAQAEKPEPQPTPGPSGLQRAAAWGKTLTQIRAAKTVAAFDAAFAAHSIPFNVVPSEMSVVVEVANSVGHPEAVNFALVAAYRFEPMRGVQGAIDGVEVALNNKDKNPIRAQQFRTRQRDGTTKVAFTEDELKPPTVFAALIPTQQEQLDNALFKYRGNSTDSAAIEAYAIALRAYHLSLVPQNEFLDERKAAFEAANKTPSPKGKPLEAAKEAGNPTDENE